MTEIGAQAIVVADVDQVRVRAELTELLQDAGVLEIHFEEVHHASCRLSCGDIAGGRPHTNIDAWGHVNAG